ncbi:MAG: XisI protein [Deinococcales bacterium]
MGSELKYEELIKELLNDYAREYSGGDNQPLKVVFDDVNQSYLILDVNWHKNEYIHHTPLHLDIIDQKIWIQYDDTQDGIATDLLAAGVPAQDIVLGFRPPHARRYTEFATG